MNSTDKWKILLVDDERHSREAMADWLESEGFETIAVADGEQAIQHVHDGIAVLVTDLKMPRTDGLQLLRLAKEQAPHAAVIVVSGYGTVETAVAALKEGAFDFLAKPINAEELTQRIRMALEKREMAREFADCMRNFTSGAASRTWSATARRCAASSRRCGWWPTPAARC
jgi:two-component system response regulator HydG